MEDTERIEEFLNEIADRYTAAEIVERLGLTEWDVIEAFRDRILDSRRGTFKD